MALTTIQTQKADEVRWLDVNSWLGYEAPGARSRTQYNLAANRLLLWGQMDCSRFVASGSFLVLGCPRHMPSAYAMSRIRSIATFLASINRQSNWGSACGLRIKPSPELGFYDVDPQFTRVCSTLESLSHLLSLVWLDRCNEIILLLLLASM